MRNLYHFFRKYYFFFLFLFLETVSLLLFFQFNQYPNAAMYRWTSSVSGEVNALYNTIDQYFGLRRVNLVLSQENAMLHSRMPESIYLADTQVIIRRDTMMQQEYRYINARVISNTVNKRNNFLMINKGRLHGIEPHMGVIVGSRLVGQVVSVSRHFSWIMSVLHRDSKISGAFLKNHQLVNVEWPGGNYRLGAVTEIPRHIVVSQGDTIVTSGNSEIFPEGILIGIIESVETTSDQNFTRATLRFLTDFSSLGYVEVVVDNFRKEKAALKASFRSL